jgi:hypothetical protein
MKPGRGFEELGAQIYRELSPDGQVALDDRILGKSGLRRQIDVSVRARAAATDLLIVIDTKDYEQPADIGEVDEFAGKLDDVSANKGILVCRGGFTKGAIDRAREAGIELSNLHDARSKDWRLEIRIPILWVDLRPDARFDITARLESGDTANDSATQTLRDWTLREQSVDEIFEILWNGGQLPRLPGMHSIPVDVRGLEFKVSDVNGEDVWRSVAHMDFVYSVSQRAYLGSLTPQECRGVLSYTDGAFTASYLALTEMDLRRDPSWPEVDDPEKLAITTAGTVITTEAWQVAPASTPVAARIDHEMRSGWDRDTLAKQMLAWAMARQCIVCGSADITWLRLAKCEAHQLAQRFGVCDTHSVPNSWPVGVVDTLDWMVDHGFGVPVESIPEEDLAAFTEADLHMHSWPHPLHDGDAVNLATAIETNEPEK